MQPASPPAPGRVLLIVASAVFLASLDLFIVNIAFPDIEDAFSGSSVSGLSWVLNGYAIVFAALLVPAGRLADRFGRRRAFLLGLGVFVGRRRPAAWRGRCRPSWDSASCRRPARRS